MVKPSNKVNSTLRISHLPFTKILPYWLEHIKDATPGNCPTAMWHIGRYDETITCPQQHFFTIQNELKLALEHIGYLLMEVGVFWQLGTCLYVHISEGHIFSMEHLGGEAF